MTIIERVARGAALLDERVPGWETKINVRELRLGSCVHCVLGQLFSGFERGVDALGLLVAASAYGFAFAGELGQWSLEDMALRAAWTAEIDRRLEARADVACEHGAVVERALDAVCV